MSIDGWVSNLRLIHTNLFNHKIHLRRSIQSHNCMNMYIEISIVGIELETMGGAYLNASRRGCIHNVPKNRMDPC